MVSGSYDVKYSFYFCIASKYGDRKQYMMNYLAEKKASNAIGGNNLQVQQKFMKISTTKILSSQQFMGGM